MVLPSPRGRAVARQRSAMPLRFTVSELISTVTSTGFWLPLWASWASSPPRRVNAASEAVVTLVSGARAVGPLSVVGDWALAGAPLKAHTTTTASANTARPETTRRLPFDLTLYLLRSWGKRHRRRKSSPF